MTKKFLYAVWSVASLLCLTLAACSDDDSGAENPPPSPSPSVELTLEGTPSPNAFSFRLTPSQADRAAWMVVERAQPAPDAARLWTAGNAVAADKPAVLTADALSPATSYTVYAVAAQGETVGKVSSLDVTTAAPDGVIWPGEIGKNRIAYHIEMGAEDAYLHTCMMQADVDTFLSLAKTDEEVLNAYRTILQLYGWQAAGSGDFLFEDGQEMPRGRAARVMAGIPYVVIASRIDADNNFVGACERIAVTTAEPELLAATIDVEMLDLKAGEVTFKMTPGAGIESYFETLLPGSIADELTAKGGTALLEYLFGTGSRVTDFTEPSVWSLPEPESPYVHYVIGVDAKGDRTQLQSHPFESPAAKPVVTENIAFDRYVTATYFGPTTDADGNPVYNYYFELADCEVEKDPEYGDIYPVDDGPGNVLICDFYTQAGDATKLQDGVYTIGMDMKAGTLGYDYTWAAGFDEEGNETQMSFASGSITVAREGENYRLTVDFMTEQGQAYTGSYTGALPFFDATASSSSRSETARRMRGGGVSMTPSLRKIGASAVR